MKKLLILGAGFLQAFVIRKAVEMGYYVIAIDKNPESVGFKDAHEYAVVDIVDIEACYDYARRKAIDGVMTCATDYGVLAASYIASKLDLNGINFQTAQMIKNKYLVRKCLHENKVDGISQYYEVDGRTDFDNICSTIKYPVMAKPIDGSGSKSANCVRTCDKLKEACYDAISSSVVGGALIEDFIDGHEYGVESFVIDGQVVLMAVMEKFMTQAPYFAELGHSLGRQLSIENDIKERVKKAIKVLGIDFGSVNMDVLVSETGDVSIVDIGARMGGNLIGSHIVPIGTGHKYLELLIKSTLNEPVDLDLYETKAIATRLLALKPGIVTNLPDFGAIEKEYGVSIHHHLKIGDKISEYKTNLDGCGYVVAVGENIDELNKKAELVKRLIDETIERLE
ncbi:ATP-grasp domain-containing protein [Acidaminobacter sp. JC074]|uniref:ATP-grasp domain-containing protein n=1 Tax=Acidaminobacter sp. JC074 TaxID=2530199 RepID=UPI001F0E1538|nr:ATP-grasp domain-containing protein [Acidaminobacter sp. JC074]MCH4889728.1 ATP-grasp domain-containing protein [Acidaminobacter sp. JC074]